MSIGRVAIRLVGTCACLALAGCGPRPAPALTVYAAASTTDVVEALAETAPSPVRTSFGASSTLARQILDGAPADVFLSANRTWMEHLAAAGALEGEPVVFARGRLVCVVPRDGAIEATDLPALARALGTDDRVAVANAGVPAGDYARQAFEHLGVAQTLGPLLVGLHDARAVLRAAERGAVAASFVYATDARDAAVRVLFEVPPESHDAIEYLAAVLRTCRDVPAARRFLEHLTDAEGRRVLTGAGFEVP